MEAIQTGVPVLGKLSSLNYHSTFWSEPLKIHKKQRLITVKSSKKQSATRKRA